MSCVKFFILVPFYFGTDPLVPFWPSWQYLVVFPFFLNQFNSLQSIKLKVTTAFFSICHWIPSGAHSFHGQVVYGFILSKFFAQLLPNKTGTWNSFMQLLIYFISHLFIYLFCDQFPRGILGIYALWAQGKANKSIHPLWEHPRHNVSHWAYYFGLVNAVNYLYSLQLCWTSGPVLVG